MPTSLVAAEPVAQRILLIRGQKVMLDADLAELYGVPTKVFNQAIKRNFGRFPVDFMFQLTDDQQESLRSQFVTLKTGRGQHRKYLPYAFTEHGAIMAATILNSPKAARVGRNKRSALRRTKPLHAAQCPLVIAPYQTDIGAIKK